MITPIDKLPEEAGNSYKIAAERCIADILQIIRGKITLCEIDATGYSQNYQRSAISGAIRRACHRYNREMGAEPGNRVGYDQFELISRKDKNKVLHWYIRYQPKEA